MKTRASSATLNFNCLFFDLKINYSKILKRKPWFLKVYFKICYLPFSKSNERKRVTSIEFISSWIEFNKNSVDLLNIFVNPNISLINSSGLFKHKFKRILIQFYLVRVSDFVNNFSIIYKKSILLKDIKNSADFYVWMSVKMFKISRAFV